jgi:hypothetical protein
VRLNKNTLIFFRRPPSNFVKTTSDEWLWRTSKDMRVFYVDLFVRQRDSEAKSYKEYAEGAVKVVADAEEAFLNFVVGEE